MSVTLLDINSFALGFLLVNSLSIHCLPSSFFVKEILFALVFLSVDLTGQHCLVLSFFS